MANLTVNSELNREAIPLYTVVVRASDMGDPVLSSLLVSVYVRMYVVYKQSLACVDCLTS